MIRQPLGLRLDSNRPIREQIHEAAKNGARGVVLDAIGDLAPQRLSETGRRELRHLLRSVEVPLIALSLPTRRSFDTMEQLDERVRRADSAFAMAYELGTSLVLVRAGQVPEEDAAPRREAFMTALSLLGQRADHRGIRLALETGEEPPERLSTFLEALKIPSLAVSIDPTSFLRAGIDPAEATVGLGQWVAHAYAGTPDASPSGLGKRYDLSGGDLDWESYVGALEEIAYRGFLTVWPDPAADPIRQFDAISQRLKRL